jgi:hypothetical protein
VDVIEILVSNDERRDRENVENSEDEPKHRRMWSLRKKALHALTKLTLAEEEREEESGLQSAEDIDRGCQRC